MAAKTIKAPPVAGDPDRRTKIEPDVLAVLRQLTYDDDKVVISVQLERKLYERVNKVLEAMGGKWNRKLKAHLFDGDAAEILEDTIHYGSYADTKKELQFYVTPANIAAMLVQAADIKPHQRILEPSAGTGALIDAIRKVYVGTNIDAYEIDPKHHATLAALVTGKACTANFIDVTPTPVYDRVVMNPPFTRLQDVRHVGHAYNFLKPGGKLAAIMSPAWTYRTGQVAEAFRANVEAVRGKWKLLPPNSFAASGTGVTTGILVLNKP